MHHELHLDFDGRLCGASDCRRRDGKYHPHGDSAIYDALVRMAQLFSLRVPLVHGKATSAPSRGPARRVPVHRKPNSPHRRHLALGMRQNTVEMRPTYDSERQEPVVLPAQFPNCRSTAVGHAVGLPRTSRRTTWREVINAAVYLIENAEASTAERSIA